MTWHYQIRHRQPVTPTGEREDCYEIVEVYTDPFGVTEHAITPYGESSEELIHVLDMMLKDARKWPVLEDGEQHGDVLSEAELASTYEEAMNGPYELTALDRLVKSHRALQARVQELESHIQMHIDKAETA